LKWGKPNVFFNQTVYTVLNTAMSIFR